MGGSNPDAPFDQPFYILFNLAVGGLYTNNAAVAMPAPWEYLVDYVRVWGLPASNSASVSPPPSFSPTSLSSPPPVSSSLTAPPGGVPQPAQTLIWSDEFNGASLDANSWSPMLGEWSLMHWG